MEMQKKNLKMETLKTKEMLNSGRYFACQFSWRVKIEVPDFLKWLH